MKHWVRWAGAGLRKGVVFRKVIATHASALIRGTTTKLRFRPCGTVQHRETPDRFKHARLGEMKRKSVRSLLRSLAMLVEDRQ